MKKSYLYALLSISIFLFHSCFQESKLLVKAEFQATIDNNNHTAPVKVTITNNSTGADFYQWTFEGAEPASSTAKEPESITYSQAGTYIIRLEAWNNHERDEKEFTIQVDSAVSIAFGFEILINDIAPSAIKIINQTEGASTYDWIFEGGVPARSTEQHPQEILFDAEGEHKITLTVSNGRENFSLSKTFVLRPAMVADFEITPSFDDFDYEAPLTAQLNNLTVNGLSYKWESIGGIIDNPGAEETSITFQEAGTYTVTLTAFDGKNPQQVSKEITIKENTNLYTLQDVKLGIKGAENTVGCYYSLETRSVIPSSEVSAANGGGVNLAFFALDAGFSHCYFTSPADVVSSGFKPIPNAAATFFINKIEDTPLDFTDSDFIGMKDDSKLKQLQIRENSNTTSWFTNIFIPRLILFETQTGVKGCIRIKAFVSEGSNSYILADIKVQKNSTAK